MANEYPAGTRFIATHGPHYTAARLRSYRAELMAMHDKVRAGLAAGKTAKQLKADGALDAWSSRAYSFVSVDHMIDVLVDDLQPPPVGKPSVVEQMVPVLLSGRGDAAVAEYRRLKSERPDAYAFEASQVNELGYVLLEMGRMDDAIAIFKLNVEENPRSGNAYDSLGEGYMKAGQQDLAIASYTKSLELDPGNMNAVEMLARLRTTNGPAER